MDLSIVIINWNGWPVLKNCLASIYGTQQTVAFEVIVVDNASSDNSIEAIERDFNKVVIIRNDQNLGFAAANNRAFTVARGRYILLLNNDTLLLDGALDNSVSYMDAAPKAGALGCRVEFPDRSFQTTCYRFSDLLELFMVRVLPIGGVFNERLNIARYWGRQFKSPTSVDVIAGCFLLVRREVIITVGGLDEDFFMYGEDEEWCSRIKSAGWDIVYFPGATIIHIHRFSSSKTRRAHRVMECMSPMLVLHKRRGHLVAWLANLILLVSLVERLPFWLAADIIHVCRGRAGKDLLRSRLVPLAAHINGIISPVWLPRRKKAPAKPMHTVIS